MDFLEKLNLLMERHNYNKNSLSKASGIPYTTIDNWYKRGYDNLQLPTVKKLCSFFGTSLDFWLKEEITNPNYGKSNGFTVDYDEMEHIKKYRYVAEHSPEGAKTVTYILDRELAIAKQISKLEKKSQKDSDPSIDKITSAANLYSALSEEDIAALEHGAELLQAQAFSFGGEAAKMDATESLSKKGTTPPPDMSAFTPEDLKALENGKSKMLSSKKNA